MTKCLKLCFFFFSSGRRHTSCSRDWSSDVCSSDLEDDEVVPAVRPALADDDGVARQRDVRDEPVVARARPPEDERVAPAAPAHVRPEEVDRSEERRVGKECRSGWAPEQEEKKCVDL